MRVRRAASPHRGRYRGDVHVSWTAANARRLRRQYLLEPSTSAVEVVRAMLGAHAQVMSAGVLSVAVRLDEATCADVQAALADGSLVKTHGPRGTVHLLPAADLGMWTGAFASLPAGRSPFAKEVRMTAEQTEKVCSAIGEAVAEGPLTLDELDEQVVARAGAWAGDLVMPAFQTMWPRWRQAQALAAQRGLVCFGPDQGRKVTYAAPPAFEPMEPETAGRELVLHYLRAYGPGSPEGYAKWHAAPTGWAAAVFATLAEGGTIEQVDFGGRPAWLVTGDTDLADAEVPGVRLLPYFDAYPIASQPREWLFPGKAFERALAGGQAGNYPVLLVDGEVAGVWHQKKSGRRVQVAVEPLRRLGRSRVTELEAEVDRIGARIGALPDLRIGQVTVGPHA